MIRNYLLASSALSLLLLAVPAAAQTGPASDRGPGAGEPADIVVTANKRSERLQDVPIAISALADKDVQNRHITSALDLNNIVPGLRLTTSDAAANPKIFIRGVGLSDFNPGSASGVGIYVDGVYVGSPLAQLAGFYDIDRIEVLRGPQGTLYGRNTTGGAINVITKRPTWKYTGDASVDYGEYSSVTLNAGVGGPIIADKLAFRVSGQRVSSDGFADNRLTRREAGAADRWAVRGQLLFTPASNVEILAQASFFRNRGDAIQVKHRSLFPTAPQFAGSDGLCAPAYYNSSGCTDLLGYSDTDPRPRSLEDNVDGKDKVDVTTANLSATIEMGAVDLIAITAYQNAWRDDRENTDASPLQMIEGHFHTKQRQFSQELRLQSHGQTRLRWVAGAYYMHDHLNDDSSFDTLRDLRPMFITDNNPTGLSIENSVGVFGWPNIQKVDSYAVFGQADYDVSDRLTLTGGLRWSADRKSLNYTSQVDNGLAVLLHFNGRKTFSDWSGRAGINYRLGTDARIYATYNRGYKSGGFFGGLASSIAQIEPYDNEILNAYEVGLKTNLFGRKIRANLSAFYYDYQNQQVFSQVLRNGLTMQILDNAASSRSYGGEAELAGEISRNLSFSFSVAYLDSKILKYVSDGQDFSGNVLQNSPKWSIGGSISYNMPLADGSAIVSSIDANWRSRVFFDNTQRNRLSDGPATVVNGQIGWRSSNSKIEMGVFAKNLFNKTYLLYISPIDSLGVDELSYAPPRVAGAYARINF